MGLIGSYGWNTNVAAQITSLIGNIHAEVFPPVIIKGFTDKAAYTALDALADAIAEKHRDIKP